MSFLKQFNCKEINYGYALENATNIASHIVKPPKLSKIRLTPTRTKFLFYGTRSDILKWMEEHSSIIVEYDTSEDTFSPSSSPPLSYSVSSSPQTPFPSSPLSFHSIQSFESQSKITFDLFGHQTQNSPVLTDNPVFYRPLHFAKNHLPWSEVVLEIRLSDPVKDSKYDPVRRVILNSGITIGEAAKALNKSWKNILPDNCKLRNSFSSSSDNEGWKNILPDSHNLRKTKSASTSDDEDDLSEIELQQKHHKFLEWLPAANIPWSKSDTNGKNRKSSFSMVEMPWNKRRDKSPELVPPGILIPYNMEEALKQEAEKDKEDLMADLPSYESIYNDSLLERGPSVKKPLFYDNKV
ncbi:13497_t:CDS:2 [Cetraspora pellucida]|uniref:13497_t:CDS:1 n=1 Tax=Cetraspora pellucida TaxID=1433469 RepID=A0ACA9K5Z1_9GLOM|nr:13497_t:CDS:2 [Cetraspora pellucida]